jgi:hypothetical protein
MLYHPNIRRCQHIKVNGTQCGSPAVRRNSFCYFHGRWREQRILLGNPRPKAIPSLDLPVLEDANSIQVAIMQVMSLLLTGQVEHKTAGLLLYGLQTASGNLRRARFEAYPTDVVINPATVAETRMGEDVWKNSDFNVAEEEEAEEDGEEEDGEDEEDEDGEDEDGEDEEDEDGEDEQDETISLAETDRRTDLEKATPVTDFLCGSGPLPPDWKDTLRTQIATMVGRAALQHYAEEP